MDIGPPDSTEDPSRPALTGGQTTFSSVSLAATCREERLAQNEKLFRTANEQMEGQHQHGSAETYLCECASPRCRGYIGLLRGEYEHVRSSSSWFVVVSGHEVPHIESVVAVGSGWTIVEKGEAVEGLLRSDASNGPTA